MPCAMISGSISSATAMPQATSAFSRLKSPTIGIFRFHGRYYVDSFREWGTSRAKNGAKVRGAAERLSVYYRQNDVTRQVCELRWNDAGGH